MFWFFLIRLNFSLKYYQEKTCAISGFRPFQSHLFILQTIRTTMASNIIQTGGTRCHI